MNFPSKPVVEPVTGENVCPRCKGNRILPANLYTNSPERTLRELQKYYEAILWADDGTPYFWCQMCGGSGTATDAMERLLIGTIQYDATER